MIEFNSNTEINKEFKVKDLLKMINADKDIKKEAQGIDKIILSNVISSKTMNIESNDKCKEIYIFRVVLKQEKMPINFIKALDKYTSMHTFFEVEFNEKIKGLFIYRYSKDGKTYRGSVYENNYTSDKRKLLPYVLSIEDVYEQLIIDTLSLFKNQDECLDDYLLRYEKIQKLTKEIAVLDSKTRKEVQPRKKFDLHRLREEKKRELDELVEDKYGQT